MMPDCQPQDVDHTLSDSASEEPVEDAMPMAGAGAVRSAWLRLPTAARALVLGTLGAACIAAVLLRRRDSGKDGEATFRRDEELVFLHRTPSPGTLRMLALVDWDESKGVLAREADGMPGMPPVTANAPSPYGGTIGSWNGKAPQATSINDAATPGLHCEKNEELFLGMCYKNCTLLTGGIYSIRFAPNGCCKNLPCMTPSEVDMQGFAPGTGYMVSAAGDGHYPHSPGQCSGNEESHLGMCYKKCSLLTNDEYPHRVAANTCCKQSPCWNPFNLDTKGKFCEGYGVGGGMSRDDQCPHKPGR
mmetsp:Transcript_117588/g.285302  ORF Transcript_117588/g.285302 Transcript_117588/m.285302 type:complete len:303 (-) Transcript_117588:124-1032(-)